MLAIYDERYAHQMPSRLKTTAMTLGLVRLLQDARRTEEARMTLDSLESGFQVVAKTSDMPSREACKSNRLKGASRCRSCSGSALNITQDT